MILKGHENDLEFIETLLDEQKSKSLKLPLSVFLKMSSIPTIMKLLDKNGFLKIKSEVKPQLVKKETFENIVKNKKEELFLEHLKSKSGDINFKLENQKKQDKLRDEIFSEKNLESPQTELEIILEKLESVCKSIEDEEHIGEVRRFFRKVQNDQKKGEIESLENSLLKGFRKMRKLYIQDKMKSKTDKEKFIEIERMYSKLVVNLNKNQNDEDDEMNQVS
jgi:uncharacterized protein with ParB-like and HNH nuclease domain